MMRRLLTAHWKQNIMCFPQILLLKKVRVVILLVVDIGPSKRGQPCNGHPQGFIQDFSNGGWVGGGGGGNHHPPPLENFAGTVTVNCQFSVRVSVN